MTIQDAIKHAEDVVAKCDNKECSNDHKQLAIWLKELVALREKNLWHDAQGDYLPEIDREVIVFTQNFLEYPGIMRVAIAHRPNPDGWDGRNILTDEVTHYTPQTYGKGGWNFPDIKWWLDLELPIL